MDHSAMSPSVLVFERFFLKLTVMMGKASNDHSAELCYVVYLGIHRGREIIVAGPQNQGGN